MTDESGGRDADLPSQNPPIRGNYSFTHGVAQAANVAMTKFFDSQTLHCDHDYRQAGAGAEPQFSRDGYYQRARYSIVMMNGKNPLPSIEFPGTPPTPGPGASIFNHSWYADVPDPAMRYEAVSRLFDQTTRNPAFAFFDFGAQGAPNVYYGAGDPILHVVATGNYFSGADHTIQAPGLAKNVLTVGATETYNQESYTNDPLCVPSNDASHADNTNEIASLSRISPDTAPQNYRYKPELVAPGTRAYGRTSSQYQPDGSPYYTCFLCNPDLTHNGQYAWYQGTSFSAPVVTGAAAITREWLRVVNGTLHFSDPWVWPSPALVKATLIAAAKPLPESTAPPRAQGFGGVSLDSLFRPAANYYFFDQKFILPNQGNEVWEKTLVANGGDVAVALVWTDRFSASSPAALVNNLDLRVMAYVGSWPCSWFGNNFSNGYSHAYCNPVETPVYDSVNTAEKVLIPGSQLPAGTPITIRVGAFSLTGDALTYRTGIYDPLHIDWEGTSLFARQDFALAVINAHE